MTTIEMPDIFALVREGVDRYEKIVAENNALTYRVFELESENWRLRDENQRLKRRLPKKKNGKKETK